MKRFFISAVVIATMLMGGAGALAQNTSGIREGDQAGLKIAPTKYETTIVQGQPKDGVVDVFNLSPGPLTVEPRVENIRMVGDAGELEFFIGDNPFRLDPYIQLDRTPFTLGPGEARRVTFRVNLPVGIPAGGYFGAVLFRVVPPADPNVQGNVIKQSGQVGTLVILTAEGETDRKGEVRDVEVLGSPFGDTHTVAFDYQNTGQTGQAPLGLAYRPKGSITIKNVFGMTVARREVSGELVFPGATRESRQEFKKDVWFGPYTVEARLAPGEGPETVQKTTFWAASWQVVAALGVVALAALAVRSRRRIKRN